MKCNKMEVIKFKPTTGRIAIRFPKALIDRYEKERPKDLSWGTIIVLNTKDYDLTVSASCEIGKIEDVNYRQKFFQAGDTVLMSYLVFIDGRYFRKRKYNGDYEWHFQEPKRKAHRYPSGDELYWGYDGTDGWNDTEIYAKLTEEGLLMCPGYILINEPRKVEKVGSIFMPEGKREDRDKAFYATVEAINPIDAEELGVAKGEWILCEGGLSYEIRGGHGEPSHYIMKAGYVLGKQSSPEAKCPADINI